MLRDAGADREVLHNLWRRKRLLPPSDSSTPAGRRLRIWGRLLTLAAAYECFVVPFIAAFNVGHAHSFVAIGWAVDFACVLDICLNFRTTFFTAEEELIGDEKAIARRYLRKAFALDALASLPLEAIAAAAGSAIGSAAFSACRCNRLLRATRIRTVHASQIARLSRIHRLAVFWCCWLMLCHWSACVWWALANAQRGQPILNGRRPWVERRPNGGRGTVVSLDVPLAQGEREQPFAWHREPTPARPRLLVDHRS